MTPLPVSTKAVRVWIETWAGSDYNAIHFYLQFQKGGPWDERREITRRVTAADRDLLREQYAVGDETGRFNSLRDAVVAAVAVARERYGATWRWSSAGRIAAWRSRSALRTIPPRSPWRSCKP